MLHLVEQEDFHNLKSYIQNLEKRIVSLEQEVLTLKNKNSVYGWDLNKVSMPPTRGIAYSTMPGI